MGTFQYIARTAAGETVSGAIQADSEGAVVRALDEKRLFPVRVKEQAAGTPGGRRGGRVRPRDVGVLYGQLADLLRADVPVLRALEILTRSTSNRRLAALVGKVRDDVAAGRGWPTRWPSTARSSRRCTWRWSGPANAPGSWRTSWRTWRTSWNARTNCRARSSGRMAYPVLLAVVGAVIITLVLGLLVPQFRPLFEGLPHIPAPTRVLFVLSDAVRTAWPVLLVAAVLAVGGGWAFISSAVRPPRLGPVAAEDSADGPGAAAAGDHAVLPRPGHDDQERRAAAAGAGDLEGRHGVDHAGRGHRGGGRERPGRRDRWPSR